MANDWAADVKKYDANADDAVISGIVRYCGIALRKVDSSLVSFSDPVELGRVRNNFLKKKCGLTDPDETLDAAIAAVGERMKADRTKNRVTVYYLLADKFGLHHLFLKNGKGAAVSAAGAGAAAGASLAVLSTVGSSSEAASGAVTADPAPAPVETGSGAAAPLAFVSSAAAPLAAVGGAAAAGAGLSALGDWRDASPLGRKLNLGGGSDGSGAGLLWAAALGAGLLALFWLGASMWPRKAAPAVELVGAPPVTTPTPVVPQAAPAGAGIISETRAEKPVVKVYFDTGKADVTPDFAPATDPIRAYLKANPGSIVGISGYNDPTGNAAANAELSKRRAQAVQATLVEAGIPEGSIELIKPEAATDATVSKEEARRVEVYIKE